MQPSLRFLAVLTFFSIICIAPKTTSAQTETEPNNSFAQANTFAQGSPISAALSPTDQYDYFKAIPVQAGKTRILFQYTNPAAAVGPDLFIYVYGKNQSLFATKYLYDAPLGTHSDSLILNCREADTVYIMFNSISAFTYSLQYLVAAVGAPDAEPNNSFAQATSVNAQSTVVGQIGYVGVAADGYDYFQTYLPDGGTIKLYLTLNNTSGSALSDFYAYAYNSAQSQIGYNYLNDQPLGLGATDTLIISCRAQETIYFMFNSTGCFSYSFMYEIIQSGTNDVEPNNTFAEATLISPQTVVPGRIGYTGTATDSYDNFKSYLPNGGTLKLYITPTNTSGSALSDFYTYVYNSAQGQIGYKYLYDRPIGLGATDTLTLHCREQDTTYFRFNSSGCFSYTFSYEVISSGTNDAEPNNTFAEATLISAQTIVPGRIGYTGTASDSYDNFKTYLPDGGTLKLYITPTNTSGSAQSDFYAYVYNSAQGQIGFKYLYDRPLGLGATDTLTLHCREQDTTYFRFNSSGCFSYTFSYEVISSGTNDAEPNNTFAEATLISAQTVVPGRLGYSGTANDGYDNFKTYLPDGGTLKLYITPTNTSGSAQSDFYAYVYNSAQGQIGFKYLYDRPLGLGATDTLTIHCREQDTTYFRFNSNGCFSYTFSYEVIPSGITDVEPNNSFAQATFQNLSLPIAGRISHSAVSVDGFDYFAFANPGISKLTMQVALNNSSGSNLSDFYVYMYNKNQGQIFYHFYYDVPLGTMQDTLEILCLTSDTVYLLIYSNGCFSYEFDMSLNDNTPVARINQSRMGNTFGFVADVKNADQVTWNFGDGTTSNLRLPVKDFAIGTYQVVLEAKNSACNLVHRDTFDVEIEGIEYFTPTRAGSADNVGYVNMRIFGGGLDTLANVTLTLGGTVLTPFQKGSPSRSELNLMFDLKDAPFGFYDVDIELSGGNTYSFPQGMEIFQDKPGFDIVTTVSGPSLVRTNQWNNYKLTVSNDRARLANSVVACVVVPEGVETNIKDIIYKRTGKLKIDEAAYARMTIPLDFYNGTYYDGTFNAQTDTFTVDYDSIYSHIDTLIEIKIDTLFDMAYRGSVYHFLIPMIAGEGSYNINFKARSSSNGNRKIISYAWPYNLRQNPVSGETLDFIHDMGMQGAALAEFAPNPALKAVGKSAGYIDIGSKVAFTEFFDWYYGVNNADPDFYASQSLALGGELAGNMLPYGKKYEKGMDQVRHTKNRMKNATKHIELTEEIITNGGLSPTMAKRLRDDLAEFNDFLLTAGANMTQAQKQAQMDALKQYFAKQGINLTTDQLNKLLFPDDVKTNKPNELEDKSMNSVTSFDPNEIYGPEGHTPTRYLKKGSELDYVVTFENVDTALAPAQVVRVNLTLDPTKFDVKRTTLGDVTIGENTYFFEADRQTYFRDIDLRPANNVIVRVNANVDSVSGEMEWIFTSLDPATMDVLTDPLGGFLPPNVTFPEGEGSVSFTTFMRKNASQADTLRCFAEIYFDQNEPILTGTWSNLIDQTAPNTAANPLVTIENGNVMILGLNGSDGESGLESYLLYAKVGSGDWFKNPLPVQFGTEARIVGTIGETYQFYLAGQDSVGNREVKPQIAEVTVTLTDAESTFGPSFTLYPNPNSGQLFVKSNGNFADVEVAVNNIYGQVVFVTHRSFTTSTDQEIQLPNLAQGAYLVQFKNKAGKTNVQKLLIVRVN